jgi:hypothetical protein
MLSALMPQMCCALPLKPTNRVESSVSIRVTPPTPQHIGMLSGCKTHAWPSRTAKRVDIIDTTAGGPSSPRAESAHEVHAHETADMHPVRVANFIAVRMTRFIRSRGAAENFRIAVRRPSCSPQDLEKQGSSFHRRTIGT